jgi:rubrerythrin
LALVTKKETYDSISPEALADLRKHLEMLRRWESIHLRMAEEMLKKKCR